MGRWQGGHSSAKESGQVVVRSEKEWQALLASTRIRIPTDTKLDFDKHMAIVVFQGRKSTGGYAIEISGVKRTTSGLQVTVVETEPAKGGFVTMAITSPYAMVLVEKTAAKVEYLLRKGDVE